jgi:hypothetical protein
MDPRAVSNGKSHEGDRAGHFGYNAAKHVSRLMHCPPDTNSEADLSDDQADEQPETKPLREWIQFQHQKRNFSAT